MDKFISVIATALPVFLALAIGMMCRSRKFLTREGVDTLKKVIINLTLPFVLFQSFASAEYSLSSLILPIVVFAVCTLLLVLGFTIIRVSGMKSRLAPFLASGFEAGMLGFPLFALLFPNESISRFAMLVLGQEIFVFTLYKMLLTKKTDPKAILDDLLHSPTLIAVILGLIVGATGLYGKLQDWGVASIVESATDFISAPTGTVILFTVGFDLVIREIPWKRTGGLLAMRLGLMALCFGLLVLLNRTVLNGMIFEGAALLLVTLPAPYIIPIFTDEPSERVQISSVLSAMTLLTMVLFAILSVVYGLQ